MDIKKQLLDFKEALETELNAYFAVKIANAHQVSPYCGRLMEYLSEITLRGGKRIRAAILYFSYLAHGGVETKKAMQAAMSMELMQTYLLIHDDIIDNDSLRRGGPTIHKIYEKIGRSEYPECNARRFSISAAIMAGDLACSMSNEILYESNFGREDTARALFRLNKMYVDECFGEFLDILSELRRDITKKDVILTHQLKTMPYTFDAPLKIGAIFAGKDDDAIEKLGTYALSLGIAFQIHDDYLGMFGSVEKTGKPITSDLKEGKKTLLILDALEAADQKQKKTILENLGNKKVSVADLKKVRKVIVDTGSLKKSEDLTIKYVKEGIASLEKLNLLPEGKAFLLGLSEWMIKREN